MTVTTSIIVAHDDKLGIGKNDQLLWHISKDLKRFKKLTMGHPIIMGRKTYESIGKPLPGRDNIIITRNPKKHSTPEWNVFITHSIKEAINLAKQKDNQEIFIIGGGEIYKQALPFADKLYITHVKGNFNADTFFPNYKNFKIQESTSSKEGRFNFKFITLTRQ